MCLKGANNLIARKFAASFLTIIIISFLIPIKELMNPTGIGYFNASFALVLYLTPITLIITMMPSYAIEKTTETQELSLIVNFSLHVLVALVGSALLFFFMGDAFALIPIVLMLGFFIVDHLLKNIQNKKV